MARQNKMDKEISALYKKWFNCVPVNMMSLTEIMNALRGIRLSAWDDESKDAMYQALVEKYKWDGK